VGVSGVDLSLVHLQTFLMQNKVSQTGEIFLIERSGLLVASSSQEQPFQIVADKPQQVHMRDTKTPLIRSTAQILQQKFHNLTTLNQPQRFSFPLDRQSHFVQVLPLTPEVGLDWLIVIVVPEADVMGRIHANTQMTIWLCLVAVGAVILLNMLLSRRLIRPIRSLNQVSQRIAQGDFSHRVKAPRIQELSMLANSFNQMSQELQQSQQQLEEYSKSLEQNVSDRTQELQQEVERRATAEAALQSANDELKRLAYLDGLTQIANRRWFDERLQQEWYRMKRERRPLALIFCDVDYFKQYNDTYGHQMGDECLCAVARAVATAVQRSADLAARYGGEEFAVLLPETNLVGATIMAQAIQAHIQQLQLPHKQSQVSQHVTLSFGIASLIPNSSTTPEEFLSQVDQALYQAKMEGRDRIAAGIPI
jgi:diguanylate cyclase (GGDEF)-like protein